MTNHIVSIERLAFRHECAKAGKNVYGHSVANSANIGSNGSQLAIEKMNKL